jgi:hypothetical protein
MQTARMILSSIFLVLTVAILAAWIDSYRAYTHAMASYDSDRMGFSFRTEAGMLGGSWYRREYFLKTWSWRASTPEEKAAMNRLLPQRGRIWPPEPSLWCFSFRRNDTGSWMWTLPFWLPVTICGFIALALKPRPKMKFGTIDLLTIMTAAAAMLTVVALWMKAGAPPRP